MAVLSIDHRHSAGAGRGQYAPDALNGLAQAPRVIARLGNVIARRAIVMLHVHHNDRAISWSGLAIARPRVRISGPLEVHGWSPIRVTICFSGQPPVSFVTGAAPRRNYTQGYPNLCRTPPN